MSNAYTVISLFLALIIALFLAFAASGWLVRRAMRPVIRTFRLHNALEASTARTIAELGLEPRPRFSFKLVRDYKPTALQAMIRAGIVKITEEGKLYLSEETLSLTNINQSL